MAGKLSEQMRRVPTTFAAAPMQAVALLLRLQSSASRLRRRGSAHDQGLDRARVHRRSLILAAPLFLAFCAAGSVPAQAITAPAQAKWKDAAMVPRVNRADEIHLRHELRQGLERGARADVLAKVGDSNTVDENFLGPFACTDLHMAGHPHLRETTSFFGRTTFDPSSTGIVCGRSNSLSRRSAAAGVGWTAVRATEVGGGAARFGCSDTETPLTCEYRQIHPAWAVVMFGTNDSYFHVTSGSYRDAITALIRSSQRAGVVPIVVTTPPRQGDEEREQMIEEYNRVLAHEARERRLPMINLWRALHRPSMINSGLRDGTHLNVAPDSVLGMPCAPLGCGEQALRYGSNLRNLITLRTLQRLHRRVVEPVLHAEDVATLESPGRVRVIDAAGNVDPSPAKDKFKVVD